jgi:hypothetical protein
MKASEQFGRALLPDSWRACGVDLLPFSLGHAILLRRLGSPLMPPEDGDPIVEVGFGDVLVAAWVCSRPAGAAVLQLDTFPQMLWMRLKRMERFRTAIEDRFAMLQYIVAAHESPAVQVIKPGKGESRGAPWVAILLSTLMRQYGFSKQEAMDASLTEAQWLHALFLEEECVWRVESADHKALVEAANALRDQSITDPQAILALVAKAKA